MVGFGARTTGFSVAVGGETGGSTAVVVGGLEDDTSGFLMGSTAAVFSVVDVVVVELVVLWAGLEVEGSGTVALVPGLTDSPVLEALGVTVEEGSWPDGLRAKKPIVPTKRAASTPAPTSTGALEAVFSAVESALG